MRFARRLHREWLGLRRSAGYGRIGAALMVAWSQTGCRCGLLTRLADRAPQDWRWWRQIAIGGAIHDLQGEEIRP